MCVLATCKDDYATMSCVVIIVYNTVVAESSLPLATSLNLTKNDNIIVSRYLVSLSIFRIFIWIFCFPLICFILNHSCFFQIFLCQKLFLYSYKLQTYFAENINFPAICSLFFFPRKWFEFDFVCVFIGNHCEIDSKTDENWFCQQNPSIFILICIFEHIGFN